MPKIPITEKVSKQYKEILYKRRKRDVQRLRLWYYIQHHPWLSVLIALFLLTLTWFMTKVSIPLPGGSNVPLLIITWDYTVKLAILLCAFLLIFAIFTVVPREAKDWELTLAQIDIVDSCGFGPVLIAKQRLSNSDNQRYIFYSRGISQTLWEAHKQEIPKDMGVSLEIEKNFEHTPKYCISVIVSHDGFEGRQWEQLTDDEL